MYRTYFVSYYCNVSTTVFRYQAHSLVVILLVTWFTVLVFLSDFDLFLVCYCFLVKTWSLVAQLLFLYLLFLLC